MADYTVEDYKKAAKKAYNAGDVKSAKSLIARGQALEAETAKTTEADTSGMGAIKYGVDNAGKLIGKGIQGFGELAGSDTLQDYGQEMAQRNEQEIADANYQRPEGADGIVKNLREGDFVNAGKSLAYGVAEAAPQMAGGIVASSAAMASSPVIAGGLLLGGTAYGITSAMGENKSEKEEKGLDADATASDLTAAIASGLIEILPVKGGGATLKILKEGAQEVGQEGLVIGNTAVQGGAYVPDEILNRMGDAGIIGSTLAGATNTAITTVSKTGDVVFKPRQDLDPEVDQAAGDVSRMIKEISEDSGYNLKDIEPTSMKGANQTLISARGKIADEVKSAAKRIKKQVVTDLDDVSQQRFDRIIKTSNLKVGGNVTPADIKFIKDFGMQYQPVQQMVNGLYKSNVLTELNASGLKGGFSKFTDVFNPINNVGKGYNPARDVAGMLNFGAIAGTGGASLATQIPLVVGGRAIDAVTGRRSKVNRFVKKNSKKSGLATPVGTQLPQSRADIEKETKARLEIERRFEQDRDNALKANEKFDQEALTARLNAKVYAQRGSYTPASPAGFIMDQTGLNYDGVDLALRKLENAESGDADVKAAIDSYRDMIASGRREKGETLTPLKNLLVNIIRTDPELSTLKKQLAKVNKKKAKISPNVQRGIDDNLKTLSDLKASMESDMSISNRDKAVLDKALSELSKDLGSDPRSMIKKVIKEAKSEMDQPSKTDQYLKPYLSRVSEQQKAKKKRK